MALEVDTQQFRNQMTVLQAASVVDGELGKKLREAIFNELKAARNSIVKSIKFDNGDPRGTAHSIKRYMATKYLGGVVSIRKPGKVSGNTSTYEAPRKLRPGQRGGNRRKRGNETARYLSYGPQDRWFILNWINAGTQQRQSGHGRMSNKGFDSSKNGNRGNIAPRNFMQTIGEPRMQEAVQNLGKMVQEEFDKLFKE